MGATMTLAALTGLPPALMDVGAGESRVGAGSWTLAT
jgi:hypothetical protein